MPEIADATYEELWEKANGNYTNYARMYLGSTLSFAKSQAFEYQCTHEVGKEGAGHISNAIGLGVLHHPELAVMSNPWYTSIPTVLPTTKQENDLINTYTELSSKGRFSQNKGESNEFVNEIVNGYTEHGMARADEASAAVKDNMGGAQYLQLKQSAWARLLAYYHTL